MADENRASPPRLTRICAARRAAYRYDGPLWNLLDLTPEGRGIYWFPLLAY
jgi:predicted dithiol-disulfide oxidoreductase (DUF899 family)